jgi:hypothetical protein
MSALLQLGDLLEMIATRPVVAKYKTVSSVVAVASHLCREKETGKIKLVLQFFAMTALSLLTLITSYGIQQMGRRNSSDFTYAIPVRE